jgi:hypothetical protein
MIKQGSIIILAITFFVFLLSCGSENPDIVFGDGNFKKSITMIELYKVRNGVYPDSLKQIPFTSAYEDMAFSAVSYQKLDSGYRLDLVRGWMGFPEDLTYPPDFWNGLGCIESNLIK